MNIVQFDAAVSQSFPCSQSILEHLMAIKSNLPGKLA
jgi:hypothetical protein